MARRLGVPVRPPRHFPIYRPRDGECPPDMVNWDATGDLPLDWIRVMKDGQAVIAAYRLEPLGEQVFRVAALNVCTDYRDRGIGGWMLAHALGVIESLGGRSVVITTDQERGLFTRLGFRRCGDNSLKLDLLPE